MERFLDVPERIQKPRRYGISYVLDKGHPLLRGCQFPDDIIYPPEPDPVPVKFIELVVDAVAATEGTAERSQGHIVPGDESSQGFPADLRYLPIRPENVIRRVFVINDG